MRALRTGGPSKLQNRDWRCIFERLILHRGLKPAANEDRRHSRVAGNGRPRTQGSGDRSQAVQLCDRKPEAASEAGAARLSLQTVSCSRERTQRDRALHRAADPAEWSGAYLQTYLDPRSEFESREAVLNALSDAFASNCFRCDGGSSLHCRVCPSCVAARSRGARQTCLITLLRRLSAIHVPHGSPPPLETPILLTITLPA